MKNKLLKKIGSIIEEKPHQEAPKKEEEAPLSPRRKQALVTYMALLLALAFLIVTVSLFIQQQHSEGTINTLNQNANQALSRAEQLQTENENLRSSNKSLQSQVDRLTAELDAANTALEDAIGSLDDLEASYDDLQDAQTQSQEALQAMTKAQAGSTTAYNALIRALQAKQKGNRKELSEAMELLADYHQYLSQEALNLYRVLLAQMD